VRVLRLLTARSLDGYVAAVAAGKQAAAAELVALTER
jgi:hypothetical protein